MNPETRKQINRVDRLVKDAGRNIIDAIETIKEIKIDTQAAIEGANAFAKVAAQAGKSAESAVQVFQTIHTEDDPFKPYLIGVDMAEPGGDRSIPETVSAAHYTIEGSRIKENHPTTAAWQQGPPPERNPGESKYAYKQRLRRHEARNQPDDFDIDLHDDSDYETKARTSEEYRPRQERQFRNPNPKTTGYEKPRPSEGSYGRNHGKKKRMSRSKR